MILVGTWDRGGSREEARAEHTELTADTAELQHAGGGAPGGRSVGALGPFGGLRGGR